MIEEHPRYSGAVRFEPDPIVYGPVFHKRRDGDDLIDITDTFSAADEAVMCSLVVNGCLGRRVGITFSGPGWNKSTEVTIDTATEKRITVSHTRDSDSEFQAGHGRVALSLDGELTLRRRFVIL